VFSATHADVAVVAVEGSGKNSEGAIKRKAKLEVGWGRLFSGPTI
jgi:hypothetical protein